MLVFVIDVGFGWLAHVYRIKSDFGIVRDLIFRYGERVEMDEQLLATCAACGLRPAAWTHTNNAYYPHRSGYFSTCR